MLSALRQGVFPIKKKCRFSRCQNLIKNSFNDGPPLKGVWIDYEIQAAARRLNQLHDQIFSLIFLTFCRVGT